MYLRLFLTTMRFMNRSPLQSCNAAEYYGINDHWGGGGGGGGGYIVFFVEVVVHVQLPNLRTYALPCIHKYW